MLLAHQSSIKPMDLLTSVYCQLVKDPLGWLERYFSKLNSWYDYAPDENVTYGSKFCRVPSKIPVINSPIVVPPFVKELHVAK